MWEILNFISILQLIFFTLYKKYLLSLDLALLTFLFDEGRAGIQLINVVSVNHKYPTQEYRKTNSAMT